MKGFPMSRNQDRVCKQVGENLKILILSADPMKDILCSDKIPVSVKILAGIS